MPHGFVADNGAASPTSMGAARRAGAIGVSGEFGGGGTATADFMAITARAIDRLLVATGVIELPTARPFGGDAADRCGSCRSSRHSQGIFATRRGWFEPATRLGQSVSSGDLAGWYHDLERLDVAEEPLRFAEGGVVISRRLHTMCEAGDCLDAGRRAGGRIACGDQRHADPRRPQRHGALGPHKTKCRTAA